jgi:hypothetical protein
MLLAVLVVGCIAAYYFGLRPGAYAAAATLLLSLVAMVVPSYALAINVVIAVGVFLMWRIGSKKPRPADAALAVRFVRAWVKRLAAYFRKE